MMIGDEITFSLISGVELKKVKVKLGDGPASVANQSGNNPTRTKEFHAHLSETVASYFLAHPADVSLSGTAVLAPSLIPEALMKRLRALANIPIDEVVMCVDVDREWLAKIKLNEAFLAKSEPRELAIFTSKAIYANGSWADREKHGFVVVKVSYETFASSTIKFNYSRSPEENGSMELNKSTNFRSTSDVIHLFHNASQICSMEAANYLQSLIVSAKALPEADIRAIRGFGSVRWDTPQAEALESLAVNLDANAKIIDYATKTSDEINNEWASYPILYPGIKLSSPLSTVQYSDRSGLIRLHFFTGKLQMVERLVSKDIQQNSMDALNSMCVKYGPAKRELRKLSFGKDPKENDALENANTRNQLPVTPNHNDGYFRFTWETDFGRIIAFCGVKSPELFKYEHSQVDTPLSATIESANATELVPADNEIMIYSIAYHSKLLLTQLVQKETEELKIKNDAASKKKDEEKDKIKSKTLKDL